MLGQDRRNLDINGRDQGNAGDRGQETRNMNVRGQENVKDLHQESHKLKGRDHESIEGRVPASLAIIDQDHVIITVNAALEELAVIISLVQETIGQDRETEDCEIMIDAPDLGLGVPIGNRVQQSLEAKDLIQVPEDPGHETEGLAPESRKAGDLHQDHAALGLATRARNLEMLRRVTDLVQDRRTKIKNQIVLQN